MRYRFHTADVFTDRIFGGNPLAVFPEAHGLATEQMQRIAAELNLSETAFVLPPERPIHSHRLRIFTPRYELPFAGHPTIGSACVLAANGVIALAGERTEVVFEEAAGPVPVLIESATDRPLSAWLTTPQKPVFASVTVPQPSLATLLSLETMDLAGDEDPPQAVSCGVPYTLIALRDRDALRRSRLDATRWAELLASEWAPHVYVYCREGEPPQSALSARMFAPAMGIAEDPATGAAAAALAAHLGARSGVTEGALRWTVEQGADMGRRSVLRLEAERRGGETIGIRVGGFVVKVSDGVMEIPSV